MNPKSKYLVWINRFGKLWPQIWYGDYTPPDGKVPQHHKMYEIAKEYENMSLDGLALIYPCPQ